MVTDTELFIAKGRLDIVGEARIEGVPDLIVEVLSPGNEAHDRRLKFELYAQSGVGEYWMVDVETCAIEIYVLRGQAYALLGRFGRGDTTRSEVLRGLAIPVADVCTVA
jgi:Uma2 family endonuclease